MNLDLSYNTIRNNRGGSRKEKEVDDILSGLKDIGNIFYRNASVVQWLGFLPCDQKVMGSNPGRSKGVFF